MTNSTTITMGSLVEKEPGQLLLTGELDYRDGKQLWEIGSSIIKKSSASTFTLDCSKVSRTSSVGVSLILSLIRLAEKAGKTLTIKSLPVDLDEIIKFSGLTDILPFATDFKVVKATDEKIVG